MKRPALAACFVALACAPENPGIAGSRLTGSSTSTGADTPPVVASGDTGNRTGTSSSTASDTKTAVTQPETTAVVTAPAAESESSGPDGGPPDATTREDDPFIGDASASMPSNPKPEPPENPDTLDGGSPFADAHSPTSTSSHSTDEAPDAPPELTVIFPVTGAVLTRELTVRGRARDDRGLARVTVAGAEAHSDDNFTTWQAEVSIATGDQQIEVVAYDTSGQQSRQHVTITGWTTLSPDSERGVGRRRDRYGLYRMTPSLDASHFYIADNVDDGIFVIDASSGDRLAIGSEEGMGTGFEPVRPTDVLLTGEPDTAWLLDEGQIVELDFQQNHRELIAAPTAGGGHPFSGYSTFAWDRARERAIAVQRSPAALVTVDAQTHQRRLLSGSGVGDGPGLTQPMALAIDTERNEAVVAGQYQSRLWAVDLEAGDRRTWVDFTASNAAPNEVALLAFAAATDEVLVWDRVGRLYAFEAESGNGRLVSQQLTPGVPLGEATGMAVTGELVWLYLDEHHALVALDLATGQSIIVSR